MRLTDLVPILQMAIGPVILISGGGLLLLSMTNRLGRVIDRSRLLAESLRKAAQENQPRITAQLKVLARRARLVQLAIILATLSMLLAAVLVIFGGLGFLEGRAQINHTDRGPIEIIAQQVQKLRHRVLTSSVTAPTAPASIVDKRAADAPKSSETAAKAAATDQTTTATNNPQPGNADRSNSAASPAPQAQGAAEQHPPQSAAPAPQSTPKEDNQSAAIPAASAPAATKPATARPMEPPAPTPGSKHEPGQQELAKATQASDPTAAAAWLWKATSRGNPGAPVLLADMYIKGKGVPRSCEQGLVLLRSAAAKENAPARNRLAALYANGTELICATSDPDLWGVRFEGTEGSLRYRGGDFTTDPPGIKDSAIGPHDINLPVSNPERKENKYGLYLPDHDGELRGLRELLHQPPQLNRFTATRGHISGRGRGRRRVPGRRARFGQCLCPGQRGGIGAR
jgi:hypothetical protein